MQAVRRLYFYLISFISLEVVIWGVISLARTAFEAAPGKSAINILASGLSLVLVGLPIFLLHWVIIQREVYRDESERDTRLRAVFLYAVRLTTLLPVVQNIIALINRLALTFLGEGPSRAFIGAGQTLPDNLTAIAVNLIIWTYFDRVLKRDWQRMQPASKLAELRRLYRYVWVLYSLVLTIAGVQQLLRFVFNMPVGLAGIPATMLANGLALILVAAPLWVLSWQIVQGSLDQQGESSSLLRLIVLYLVTFSGVVLVVIVSISVLGAALRWVLGETQTLSHFLTTNSDALALAIPVGVVWAYFSRQLQRHLDTETGLQRKAGLKRLHDYFLVLLGNSVGFIGLWRLAAVFVELLWNDPLEVDILRIPIGAALSALLVGLPLWLKTWLIVQRDAGQMDTSGDHVRRSVIRKGYLYLVLFLTVAGAMATSGQLLFMTFMKLLDVSNVNFWLQFSQRLMSLLLLLLWMGYHLRVLRMEGKLAHQTLGRLHARFPVLVFEMNEFSDALVPVLAQKAPLMPVQVHRLGDDMFEGLGNVKVIVLPADLALSPSESLALWLHEYRGKRILVPLTTNDWIYVDDSSRSLEELVQDTARVVCQLAEGGTIRPSSRVGPWTLTAYIFAALFGLILLFGVLAAFISGLD